MKDGRNPSPQKGVSISAGQNGDRKPQGKTWVAIWGLWGNDFFAQKKRAEKRGLQTETGIGYDADSQRHVLRIFFDGAKAFARALAYRNRLKRRYGIPHDKSGSERK